MSEQMILFVSRVSEVIGVVEFQYTFANEDNSLNATFAYDIPRRKFAVIRTKSKGVLEMDIDKISLIKTKNSLRVDRKSAPTRSRTVASGKNVTTCVSWNFRGVTFTDILRKGKTTTEHYYASLLDRLQKEFLEKVPYLAFFLNRFIA